MEYLKKLQEQRAEKVQEMETLLSAAKTENRAMSTEETEKFDTLEQEIASIDKTMQAEEREREAKKFKKKKEETEPTKEELEERAFAEYILEERGGEKNMDMGSNGAIIPTTISSRIIKAVRDRCPILERATVYNVKGTLKVPVWGDNDSHNIKVAFSDEFTELTADAGKFTSVDLGGFLAGALSLIGQSVENNGSFSVVDFVVSQMAEDIATFLEGKLLIGESSKNGGALDTNTTLTAQSATAITADELIALQAKIKQVYQANACFTMHPDTFLAIKQLKDGNGRYLLQDDFTGEFPYRLLGKPVYLSDNMPKISTGNKAILYGDYSGLSVNFRENIQLQVLREKYATQHAIGVVAWMEFDSRVTDHQKLAVLKMA